MKITLEQIRCPVGSGDAFFMREVLAALSRTAAGHPESAAIREAAARCRSGPPFGPAPGGSAPDGLDIRVTRRTTDARKKSDLFFVYNVDVYIGEQPPPDFEQSLLGNRAAVRTHAGPAREVRPVIAGFGPAGLFAALYLARAGFRPLVIERGRAMEERVRDVADYWREGRLDPVSNVQFGEGGAGTFSDGKLTTGIRDALLQAVLETFADAGAPRAILYSANPHIGTDILRPVIVTLRERIQELGGEIRFETALTGIRTEEGKLAGITVMHRGEEEALDARHLILAIGHSARDTFRMLSGSGVSLSAKSFAVGMRIEHHQKEIDRAQFGMHGADIMRLLGPASYKLACHLGSGRSVYTFCMCPGGRVIAGASAPGQVVTNGMSDCARSGANANSALLVNVTPEDFRHMPGPEDPLAGILFQEKWEHEAFRAGGLDGRAPAQYLEDFLYRGGPAGHRAGADADRVRPTYEPGVVFTDLDTCLPEFILSSIREALPEFGRKIRGFDAPGALLTGIETRSSSPVRISRGPERMSNIAGIYPCGEGAGYAGGIMSAAIDGIRSAMACAENTGAVFR